MSSSLIRSVLRASGLSHVWNFAQFTLRPAVVESARLIPIAASTPLYETRIFVRELAQTAAAWHKRQDKPAASRAPLAIGSRANQPEKASKGLTILLEKAGSPFGILHSAANPVRHSPAPVSVGLGALITAPLYPLPVLSRTSYRYQLSKLGKIIQETVSRVMLFLANVVLFANMRGRSLAHVPSQ